jgi:hypothetical protein
MKTLILLSALLAALVMAQEVTTPAAQYTCCTSFAGCWTERGRACHVDPAERIPVGTITYRMHETCTTYVRVGGEIVQVDPKGFVHVPAALLAKASAEELELLAKDTDKVGESE